MLLPLCVGVSLFSTSSPAFVRYVDNVARCSAPVMSNVHIYTGVVAVVWDSLYDSRVAEFYYGTDI